MILHVAGSRLPAGMDCSYTAAAGAENTRCETRRSSPGSQTRRSFCRAVAPATRRDSSPGCNYQRRTAESGCSLPPYQLVPVLSATASCQI